MNQTEIKSLRISWIDRVSSVILYGLLSLSVACAVKPYGHTDRQLKNSKKEYSYKDISGEYKLIREIILRKDNNFVLKYELLPKGISSKALEKGITVSKFGYVNSKGRSKVAMMRPMISQFSIWLEGKKYFSQLKTDVNNRSMNVVLQSPEKKWQGSQSIKFPSSTSAYCFFSQLIECIRATSFITKAIQRKERGEMRLYVIWDNYPYVQEQYHKMPTDVFTQARFVFDNHVGQNRYRFSLHVGDQVIFYHLNKKLELVKMAWVAQGISMKLN